MSFIRALTSSARLGLASSSLSSRPALAVYGCRSFARNPKSKEAQQKAKDEARKDKKAKLNKRRQLDEEEEIDAPVRVAISQQQQVQQMPELTEEELMMAPPEGEDSEMPSETWAVAGADKEIEGAVDSRAIVHSKLKSYVQARDTMEILDASEGIISNNPADNSLEDVINELKITENLTEEEVEALRMVSHVNTMSAPELHKRKKAEVVAKYRNAPHDCGSTAVQIALLTERIARLRDHMSRNHKDVHSRRGFEAIITRRRQLLKYLRRTDFQSYQRVMLDYGINENDIILYRGQQMSLQKRLV